MMRREREREREKEREREREKTEYNLYLNFTKKHAGKVKKLIFISHMFYNCISMVRFYIPIQGVWK